VKLSRIPPTLRRIFLPPGSVNVEALRLAMEDVIADYGPRYPKGPVYLKQLAELDRKQRAAEGGTPEQKQKIEDALKSLHRGGPRGRIGLFYRPASHEPLLPGAG
jgi:hypothetical protein